jgi:hypothetical protein
VNNNLFGGLDIREIDYSYEIDAASTLYETNGIMQLAQRLITAYAAVRRDLDEVQSSLPTLHFSSPQSTMLTVVHYNRLKQTGPSSGFAMTLEERL